MQITLPQGYNATSIRKVVPDTQAHDALHVNFIFMPRHPTWLKLSKNDFDYWLKCWYHGVECWDTDYLDLWMHQLQDPSLTCWTRQESLLACIM